jgi:hypothetical protein
MEYIFKGNKPSNAQILKKINEAINKGYGLIEISWGENMITIQRTSNGWYGSGWIKTVSGSDLADKINATIRKQTLNLWNT